MLSSFTYVVTSNSTSFSSFRNSSFIETIIHILLKSSVAFSMFRVVQPPAQSMLKHCCLIFECILFRVSFKLWYWRRRLGVPWTAQRSNQSILKEISPEYSLEGLMLKLQYFGHLMRRADSLEKTLMLGKIVGKKRRVGVQGMGWLDSITDSMDMNLSKLHKIVKGRGAWNAVVYWVTENQS